MKTPTEKKPRVVSPEIAALRAEHQAKVKALKDEQVSYATLRRILEDFLPKLTSTDRANLRASLVTPSID